MIIDGKLQARKLLSILAEKVATFPTAPGVAVVLVGENSASQLYVNNKIKKAAAIGINSKVITLPQSISQCQLINTVRTLNTDRSVHGFIIQLPLPKHIDTEKVLEAIDPSKDIDGFHPLNVGYLYTGLHKGFTPCTPLGCLHLLKSCIPTLSGKHAVIVGRSNIVGKPLAALLLKNNCTVTICHSFTLNLSKVTKIADIVITAVGRPLFFGAEYFNENAVVIDVGIHKIINGSFVGDVKFSEVVDKVKAITPVPGGVGPMTTTYLLHNTVKAYSNLIELDLKKS